MKWRRRNQKTKSKGATKKSNTRKKNLKVIYSEAAAAFTIKMSFVLGAGEEEEEEWRRCKGLMHSLWHQGRLFLRLLLSSGFGHTNTQRSLMTEYLLLMCGAIVEVKGIVGDEATAAS